MKKFVTFVFILLLLMVTSAVFAHDGTPPPIDDDIPPSGGMVIVEGSNPWNPDPGFLEGGELQPAPIEDTPFICPLLKDPGKRIGPGCNLR